MINRKIKSSFALSLFSFLDPRLLDRRNKQKKPERRKTQFFTFRVLPDRHQVDVVVPRLVPGDREARPHVGVQLQLLAERQVERPVSLPDRRGHRTFQADPVLQDGIEILARDHTVGARVDRRADVLLVPGDGHARGVEDGLDGVGDFRADT